MQTLRSLLKATPLVVQMGAKYCKILSVQMGTGAISGSKLITAVVKRRTPDGAPHNQHRCSIEGFDTRKLLLSEGFVKVSCSCEAFTYYGIEYVLRKRGAADIVHSNGKRPDIRNPKLVLFLCPHLTKLGLVVIAKNL